MDENRLYDILQSRNVFLSGGAGVGKSYLTSQIIQIYKNDNLKVIPLGSTGISAVNIGGFTIHSFFIFGIASNLLKLKENDRRNKKRVQELKKVLQEIDLIIIDEISMVSASMLDMIYYRLDTLGYKGRLMVVGDFYQLPPIIKEESINSLIKDEIYAFESGSWIRFNFKAIILDDVKRTSDSEFINILSLIREGVCNKEVKDYLISLKETKFSHDIEPTYLFGRNKEVEEMNREKLSLLDRDEALFFWDIKKIKDIDDRKIESWTKSLPIIDALHLKIGAPVIFTVNKWGKFVNGQKGIVSEFHDEYIVIKCDDKAINVYQHDFELLELDSNSAETIAVATLSQYPIKLAYAITIHKSQGMSIRSLVCNLDYLFAPSQLYVAISRAIEPKLLRVDYSRYNFSTYLDRVVVKNFDVDNFYIGLKNEN